MKDFKIIEEGDLSMLESSVNIYIHLGYTPVGCPIKTENGYAQSLYRDDIDLN